jgi:hypothetical protein
MVSVVLLAVVGEIAFESVLPAGADAVALDAVALTSVGMAVLFGTLVTAVFGAQAASRTILTVITKLRIFFLFILFSIHI